MKLLSGPTTQTGQSIASALSVVNYTAAAACELMFRVFAKNLSGDGGTYQMYVTITRNASPSDSAAYQIQPVSTITIANGQTTVAFQSSGIAMAAGDTATCYLVGLSADTTVTVIGETWDAGSTIVSGYATGQDPATSVAAMVIEPNNTTAGTFLKFMQAIAAALGGKVTASASGSNTVYTFTALGDATTNRLTITADSTGQRSSASNS